MTRKSNIALKNFGGLFDVFSRRLDVRTCSTEVDELQLIVSTQNEVLQLYIIVDIPDGMKHLDGL